MLGVRCSMSMSMELQEGKEKVEPSLEQSSVMVAISLAGKLAYF